MTLNYDQSLEYFLTLALQFSYGIDDASTVDLMSTIPIVHLYGQLGSLTEGRPYSSELSAEHIQTAANGIRIIHEDTMDPNLVAEALGLMKKADVLAFLGFGYHPLNVERLAEAIGARPGQRVMGTSYGLENNERDRVRRLFGEKLEIDDIGWDCLTYLRKRPVFR